jgi:low affinity Fe/Cu permease
VDNQVTTEATPVGRPSARASRNAQITSEERVRQGKADSERKGNAWAEWFARAATRVSEALGSALAFVVALAVIIVWAVTGPIFGFSDTWQLVINTGTTIITFLMVFVIQNTQNRDSKATQVKLDELIRAVGDARNKFIGLEDQDEAELQREKEEVETERDDVEQEHEHVEEEHENVEQEHEHVEEEHQDVEREQPEVEHESNATEIHR